MADCFGIHFPLRHKKPAHRLRGVPEIGILRRSAALTGTGS